MDEDVTERNLLGQRVGRKLVDWQPRPRPPATPMHGRYCAVVPLDPDRHGRDLFEANAEDVHGSMWTYLPFGPFGTFESYRAALESWVDRPDWATCAVIAAGKASGVASYMRIDPAAGSIEVGGIMYSPRLQRTRAATEAMYLMMARAFDELRYRRYEWKCDSLNEPSIRAARRYGFQYEGLFRQAVVVKGRNRDTSWFSIIDCEWPVIRAGFEAWLSPENFDAAGRPKSTLEELRLIRSDTRRTP
jgi:RimJ/RimL family protein N-acetyltransferase